MVSIPLKKFDTFVDKINLITSKWKTEDSGTKDIKWQIKINTKMLNKTIIGNGEYPSNWNKFIDLVSEYEILLNKTIIYNQKVSKLNLNRSLEKIVGEKVQDPFFC